MGPPRRPAAPRRCGALEADEDSRTDRSVPARKQETTPQLELTPGHAGVIHRHAHRGAGSRAAIPSSGGLAAPGWRWPARLPLGCAAGIARRGVANPKLFFAHASCGADRERHHVRGVPVDASEVAANQLAPLPQRARRVTVAAASQDSDDDDEGQPDLYAETLLKAIGADGASRRCRASAAASQKIFEGWKIGPGSYVQADGSACRATTSSPRRRSSTLLERDAQGSAASRRVCRRAADRRQGRHHLDADEEHARGRERRREDRSISNVRALLGYVPHAGRGDARLLDPRQQLHDPPATVNWIADLAVERWRTKTDR